MPHASAATSTSRKPTSVAVAPPINLYAASSTTPDAAINGTGDVLRGNAVAAGTTMPSPIVKNTCTWMTSDDSPAGMPSFMPRNSRPNWQTPMATP